MNIEKTPAHSHEEPEITQEESVPTDGPDTQGEEAMKKVVNPKLEESKKAEPDSSRG